jgi:hypothetical protein
MHTISIYVASTSGGLNFECATCLMDERVRKGIHIVRMVSAIFSYPCFGKKSHSWSNTECRPDVLLKRPNECKLKQFEASQHRGRSGRKILVIRMDDALTVESLDGISRRSNGCCLTDERQDGIPRRSDGCKGSDFFDLESVQNLLETYLWRRLLKIDWTPDLKASLFMLLSNECLGVSLDRSDDKLGIRLLLSCRICRVSLEFENSFLMLVTLILS